MKKKVEVLNLKLNKLTNSRVFTNPMQNIENNYLRVDKYIKSLENSIKLKQKEAEKSFIEQITKLDALSPLKTLTRGYSIIEKEKKLIKSSKELTVGDEVQIRLIDGEKKAKILK